MASFEYSYILRYWMLGLLHTDLGEVRYNAAHINRIVSDLRNEAV